MKKWMGIFLAAAMMAQLTACKQGNNAIRQTLPEETKVESSVQADIAAEGQGQNGAGESKDSEETVGMANQESDVIVSENENLNEIYQGIRDAYGDSYSSGTAYTEEKLAQRLNIDPAWCEAYLAEEAGDEENGTLFVAVKAQPDMADSVEKVLLEYQDMLMENASQHPSRLAQVQASQIVRYGDYVFFVMLGEVPEGIEDELEAFQTADESNQKAVDVIDAFFEQQ
ncbi:MAG: DUF4358 domain-containing protein [bacterium]|nr:DUF4358 domain-containing protein [bacterium]